MFYYMSAMPAYGMEINSKEEAIKAWNAGKDFFSFNARAYFSIRDIKYLREDGCLGVIISTPKSQYKIDL